MKNIFLLTIIGFSHATNPNENTNQPLTSLSKVQEFGHQITAQLIKYNSIKDTKDHAPILFSQVYKQIQFLKKLSDTLTFYLVSDTAKHLETGLHAWEFKNNVYNIRKYSQILFQSYFTLSHQTQLFQNGIPYSADVEIFKQRFEPHWNTYSVNIELTHRDWESFTTSFSKTLSRALLESFKKRLLQYTELIQEFDYSKLEGESRWFYVKLRELCEDTILFVDPWTTEIAIIPGYKKLVDLGIETLTDILKNLSIEMDWFMKISISSVKTVFREIEIHADNWNKLLVI